MLKSRLSKNNCVTDLNNCTSNKRGAIFFCGSNLLENSDCFEQIMNDPNFVTLAYKNSTNILPKEPDILFLDTRIKDTQVPTNTNTLIVYNNDGSNIDYNDIYRSDEFKPDIFINSNSNISKQPLNYIGYGSLDKYKFDEKTEQNIIYNHKTSDNYSQSLLFMNYIGIKEIYIFGLYNLKEVNVRQCYISNHFNNIGYKYIIETGHMMHALSSHFWYQHLQEQNCNVYNVSNEGVVCNKIPRIKPSEIYVENKKVIDCDKTDCCLYSFIQNRIDLDYYSTQCDIPKNCDMLNVIYHYITTGFYIGQQLNSNDNHSMVDLDCIHKLRDFSVAKNYDIDLVLLYLLLKYPSLGIRFEKNPIFPFFSHILVPCLLGERYRIMPYNLVQLEDGIQKEEFDYVSLYKSIHDNDIIGWGCFEKPFSVIKPLFPYKFTEKQIAYCNFLLNHESNIDPNRIAQGKG